MKKIVISVVLINLLAACASQQQKAPVQDVAVPSSSNTSTSSTSDTSSTSAVQGASTSTSGVVDAPRTLDPFNDPSNILYKRSVYYPFDVSTVQDSDKPVVVAHAKYLIDHANRKVRLEGNCDERGSNEYNLALGQRRADGVKKMMELAGVNESQLDSVSYGEEKPRASGHDEDSWAQNRRTDLNYIK